MTAVAEPPGMLTVEEVAGILRVNPKTVYRAIERGELPGLRFGRVIRVPRHALEQTLERRAAEAVRS